MARINLQQVALIVFDGDGDGVERLFAGRNGSAKFLSDYNLAHGTCFTNLNELADHSDQAHSAVHSHILSHRGPSLH